MVSNYIQNLSKNYLNWNLLLKSCNIKNNTRILWYNLYRRKAVISLNNNYVKDDKELLKLWNYKRNNNINLECLLKKSGKKVWWKCPMGHEWEATVSHVSNGTRCPYCSGQKILKGFNDLASSYPDLLKEDGVVKRISYCPTWLKRGIEYRDKYRCSICGCDLSSAFTTIVDENFDHIIPLKVGGNNDPSNWQLTCGSCNKSKGARSSNFKNIVFPFWEIGDAD